MPYRVTKHAEPGIQDESAKQQELRVFRGFVCPATYQCGLMKQKVWCKCN